MAVDSTAVLLELRANFPKQPLIGLKCSRKDTFMLLTPPYIKNTKI